MGGAAMSSEGPLHPQRIRKVLQVIAEDKCTLLPEELETCRCALELVRKGQLALGLSDKRVSAVSEGVQLLQAFGRLSESMSRHK